MHIKYNPVLDSSMKDANLLANSYESKYVQCMHHFYKLEYKEHARFYSIGNVLKMMIPIYKKYKRTSSVVKVGFSIQIIPWIGVNMMWNLLGSSHGKWEHMAPPNFFPLQIST